ncbi:energy-coupling factor transporter transmembrane component T [Neobacillus sp. FSL H8-0543]|uniref:energy-coupling factor transporter transmembrane component T n=1 Tax=Neobacillus sp. FSL H8-0543 TaxID=2954672 RepID=UPI0031596977
MKGIDKMEKSKNLILDLYPSTKFLISLFMIISVFIVEGYLYGYLMVPLSLLIALYAGVFKELFSLVMKTLFVLTIFIFMIQSFFYPGDTILWSWSFLSLRQEGIDFAMLLTSRIAAIGSALLLFFRITSVKDIVYSLEMLGLPPKVTYVVLSTLTIIPEMKKLSLAIMDAQKTRGVETEGNLRVRAKAFLPTLTPLILTSVASTEERALTLEARAFTAPVKKTSLYRIDKTKKDTVVRILLLILLVTIIVWRVAL